MNGKTERRHFREPRDYGVGAGTGRNTQLTIPNPEPHPLASSHARLQDRVQMFPSSTQAASRTPVAELAIPDQSRDPAAVC